MRALKMLTPSTMNKTLILGLLLLSTAAFAGKADQALPMNIEADNLRYEDGSKTSVFSGNVALNKGSIVMRGVRLEVSQDNAGNQNAQLLSGAGRDAYFKQKRDVAGDEYIEAQADRISYDSKSATVKLMGKASLRRLSGNTKLDETTGAVITYNGNTDVFTVDGGGKQDLGGASVGTTANGRVRVTLTSRAGQAEIEQANKNAAGKTKTQLKPSQELPRGTP